MEKAIHLGSHHRQQLQEQQRKLPRRHSRRWHQRTYPLRLLDSYLRELCLSCVALVRLLALELVDRSPPRQHLKNGREQAREMCRWTTS